MHIEDDDFAEEDAAVELEAFLLIEQPRQRIGHWTQALAALDAPDAPSARSIHAYYDPISDQALLDLRYEPAVLGARGLGFVVEVALLAEVGMVQPAELTEFERTRFLSERLSRCTIQVTYAKTVIAALSELVRKIKDQQRHVRPQPPPIPQLAKGTRENMPRTTEEALKRESERPTKDMKAPAPSDGLAPPTFQGVGATPYLPASAAAARDMIYARYLRGGRWVPIRIGSLSLKGAALMTGALPRLHDHVDVALTFGGHRALVRGSVGKVSTQREAAATGAATFSVDFELDPAARRQLTALLTAARAANVTIKPPPARSNRRFPVTWPVCLGTERGALKADALDISTGGMFVQPAFPLQRDAIVGFSILLDDETSPVGGRAKVVRHIGDSLSRTCGIPAGYGLTITEMKETDRMRWLAFLARVERRAEKRVLVGASPARLAELQTALESCGYAVTGGTDPGALVQLARAGERPVDVALIDSAWLADGASASWVESLFTARDVPCVTLQGDARRARSTIDRLLEVVV